jgi:hypothetical protein
MVIEAGALFPDITGKDFPAGLRREDVAERLERTVQVSSEERSVILRAGHILIGAEDLHDARILLLHRDAHIRETLVITEKDIVVRLVSFDEIALEQKCLEFGADNNIFKISYVGDHSKDLRVTLRVLAEVGAETVSKVLRFSYIYDRIRGVLHQVHSRIRRYYI